MSLKDALDLALAIEQQVKEARTKVTYTGRRYTVALSVGSKTVVLEQPSEYALLKALWERNQNGSNRSRTAFKAAS